MNQQRPLILLLLLAYIFSPKLFSWVIDPIGGWYKPYIIWVIVVIVAFVIQTRKKSL